MAEHRNRFLEAMDDDFNTGGGIGTLFDLVRAINKYADDEKLEEPAARSPEKLDAFRRAVTVLRELTATLGLFRKAPEEKATGGDDLMGKLLEPVDRAEGRSQEAEGFCHGRPDSQHAGRDRDCARRSAQRDRMEPEVVKGEMGKAEGGKRRPAPIPGLRILLTPNPAMRCDAI